MGHCSNRPDTREEKLGRWAKEIAEKSNSMYRSEYAYEQFQFNTGAEIRGELGIKKGNEFIEAMRKASNKY